MILASSLATAIYAANGEDHRTRVIVDGHSLRSVCACGWSSDLEGSVTDAMTAAFLEHLEPVALRSGVEFELA
jgi:hypothetical protein